HKSTSGPATVNRIRTGRSPASAVVHTSCRPRTAVLSWTLRHRQPPMAPRWNSGNGMGATTRGGSLRAAVTDITRCIQYTAASVSMPPDNPPPQEPRSTNGPATVAATSSGASNSGLLMRFGGHHFERFQIGCRELLVHCRQIRLDHCGELGLLR